MKECIICFDNDQRSATCVYCKTEVCITCLGNYIIACKEKFNKLPICPYCKEEYIADSFSSKKSLTEYSIHLEDYLRKNSDFMSKIDEKFRIDRIIHNMREEKINFIERLPSTIKIVANTVYSKKLQEVMKVNIEHINVTVNAKKCVSGICSGGYLTDDNNGGLLCDNCRGTFCIKCEKPLLTNHTCVKEDLESINYIADLVHCPKCHIPVEKNGGCSNLTCGVCKTLFTEDGNLGGYGGHDSNVNLKSDNQYKLYKEIRFSKSDKYSQDLINKIKTFELSVVNYDEKIFANFYLEFFRTEDHTPDEKVNLFKEYSKSKIMQNQRKKHYEKIMAIRQLYIDDNLNEKSVYEIINN